MQSLLIPAPLRLLVAAQNLHALNNAVEIGMLGGILHTQGADTVLPVLTALQHKSVQISLRRGKAEVLGGKVLL